MKLFFKWKLENLLDFEKAKAIYHELHVITAETAFVVRTLFFVIFGITIVLSSLLNIKVALVSILIILSIYIIRFVLLRIFMGKDISPQVWIAPRGLITVLLFYAIPAEAIVAGFEPGILLFVIIGTSLIMTGGMIRNKKTEEAIPVETENETVAINDQNENNIVETTTEDIDRQIEDTSDISSTNETDESYE